MGGKLLREVGEAEDESAGGRRVNPGGSDRAGLAADRRRGWGEAAVLEAAAALGLRHGAGWATQLVETIEPILAIEAAEVGVADGGGVGDEALLEARPGFGRCQRLGFELVAPQSGVERLGLFEQSFERFAPGFLLRGSIPA